MSRPVLLDVGCGLGGAARGYQRAGFYVVGVDVVPQPDYCGDEFHQADGFAFLIAHYAQVDAAHTSWPCQASSAPTKGSNARRNRAKGRHHLDLNPAGRALLQEIHRATGMPYVMENVPGSILRRDVTLCGEMFGLPIIRHRYFELGGWTMPRPHHPRHRGYVRGWRHGIYRDGPYLAVYGDGGGKASTEECRAALGIDWSWDRDQLVEAVPPAYAQHIGEQLLARLAQPAPREVA